MRKKIIELPRSYGEITEKELRAQGPPRIFDNTMRVTYKQCARKFYWWKVRKVDYLIAPTYFAWGQAWHEIKGYWLTSEGCKAQPFSPTWKEHALIALLVGQTHWDNSGAIESIKQPLDTRENLRRLWKEYLRIYPNEDFEVLKGGAEVGWIYPLPLRGGQPSRYYLGGSMDGIIKWEGFGIMPLEVKTTGMWLSDWWLLQWNFSSQITGYIWYVQQLLGTETISGAYLDCSTKQDTRAAKAATTPQFSRNMQTRTEDQLKEFENDWRMDIELVERSYDKWHFPKTTDTVNCTGGIGKSRCPYSGLCLSGLRKGRIDPLAFPDLTYRKEEWRPWERSPQEQKRQSLKALPTGRVSEPKSISPIELKLSKTRRILWND